jgi:hypothetical protein
MSKQFAALVLITVSLSVSSIQLPAQTFVPVDMKVGPGPAAYRTEVYTPGLKGKRVGVMADQSSMVGDRHIIDTLLALGIHITKAFAPEQGLRIGNGKGKQTSGYIDQITGIPVVVLTKQKRKLNASDLDGVDVLLFDMQDLGVRTYPVLGCLHNFMEAAFENAKPLMLLDRPNPNGFRIEGPVAEEKQNDFGGKQPVPAIYGMTLAEYAFMVAGENWLSEKANTKYAYYLRAENSPDTAFHFQVIKCAKYTHKSKYILPHAPYPSITDMDAVYHYVNRTVKSKIKVKVIKHVDKVQKDQPDKIAAFKAIRKKYLLYPDFE